MKIDLLNKSKKKKFLEELSYLGDLKTNALFVQTGKEKIRAYTGIFSNEEIWDFWRTFAVEGVGLYIGKKSVDKNGVKEIRLGIEGLHLFEDQVVKGILVLDEFSSKDDTAGSQEEKWFLGEEVEVGGKQIENIDSDFVAVKSGESGDFLGIGKLNKDKTIVYNYLPKERRRKESGRS